MNSYSKPLDLLKQNFFNRTLSESEKCEFAKALESDAALLEAVMMELHHRKMVFRANYRKMSEAEIDQSGFRVIVSGNMPEAAPQDVPEPAPSMTERIVKSQSNPSEIENSSALVTSMPKRICEPVLVSRQTSPNTGRMKESFKNMLFNKNVRFSSPSLFGKIQYQNLGDENDSEVTPLIPKCIYEPTFISEQLIQFFQNTDETREYFKNRLFNKNVKFS